MRPAQMRWGAYGWERDYHTGFEGRRNQPTIVLRGSWKITPQYVELMFDEGEATEAAPPAFDGAAAGGDQPILGHQSILKRQLPARFRYVLGERTVTADDDLPGLDYADDYAAILLDLVPPVLPAQAVGAGARWKLVHRQRQADGDGWISEQTETTWEVVTLMGSAATLQSTTYFSMDAGGPDRSATRTSHRIGQSILDFATLTVSGSVKVSGEHHADSTRGGARSSSSGGGSLELR